MVFLASKPVVSPIPLGGTAGGAQRGCASFLAPHDAQDRVDQVVLPIPGHGDHQHLAGEEPAPPPPLLAGGELQGEALLHPWDGNGGPRMLPQAEH